MSNNIVENLQNNIIKTPTLYCFTNKLIHISRYSYGKFASLTSLLDLFFFLRFDLIFVTVCELTVESML